jgi:phosphate transport system substrate-binding protein
MMKQMLKRAVALAIGLTALTGVTAQAQSLTGAGATFPAPLYQQWFQEYAKEKGVQINYQAIGSGGGIKNITAKSVDFGASDAPMNAAELAAAPGILHIPTVAGAVTVAYNIPGVGAGIHLTGDVVADIFLGKITNWNDPRITKLSPGTKFPNLGITPFHRSDGSGTTNAFTTYLSEVSPDWKSQVGAGKSVRWVKGLGGKGNPGVAELIKQNEGGIGYIELAYAVKNVIPYAAIRNAAGKFIYPSVESTTAAAEGSTLPPDFRKVITNTSAPAGYPITSFTFLLVYPNCKPEVKAFLEWALTTGEKDAPGLYYAPLPANVQKRALAVVAKLQ